MTLRLGLFRGQPRGLRAFSLTSRGLEALGFSFPTGELPTLGLQFFRGPPRGFQTLRLLAFGLPARGLDPRGFFLTGEFPALNFLLRGNSRGLLAFGLPACRLDPSCFLLTCEFLALGLALFRGHPLGILAFRFAALGFEPRGFLLALSLPLFRGHPRGFLALRLLAFGFPACGLDPLYFLSGEFSSLGILLFCGDPRRLLAVCLLAFGLPACGVGLRRFGLTSGVVALRLRLLSGHPRGFLALGFPSRGLDTRGFCLGQTLGLAPFSRLTLYLLLRRGQLSRCKPRGFARDIAAISERRRRGLRARVDWQGWNDRRRQ